MKPTEKEIQDTIKTIVANSLAIERDDISDRSRLIADLGMDSLDFVDILFSLEQSFETKVRDSELNKLLRPDKAAVAKMPEFLSDDEIVQLKPLLPALEHACKNGPISRQEVFNYITIETLTNMVIRKLNS